MKHIRFFLHIFRTVFFFLGTILTFNSLILIAADTKSSENISVKAEVDHAFITIGDPVIYSVTVKHGPHLQILSQIPPPPSDVFNLKKSEDIQKKDGAITIEGRKFTLTSYRLGDFVLDPISIEYRSGQGPVQKITTDKIYITVKSVAEGEEKKDIRGVKSVLRIPFAWKAVIFLGGFAGAFLAGWLVYQHLKAKKLAPPPESKVSSEDQALNQLTELFESDLLRQGKVKEYHLRFSEILRIYLEKRYGILAVEFTTDEIIRALRGKDLEGALREKISSVLEAADLAKFAKWKPEALQIKDHYQKGREIIESSRPKVDHVPVSPS